MDSSNISFLIQARIGSTRLPGKVLMPLYDNATILDIIINRLKTKFPGQYLVLVTGENRENQVLASVAKRHGIQFFVGSEHDVLGRYIAWIDSHEFNGNIVRICADNPFLDVDLLATQIKACADNPDQDYFSYCVNGVPAILTHYGIFAEVVAAKALKKVHKTTSDMFFREHVTRYIYDHPEQFSITWLDLTEQLTAYPVLRLTIDTEQDFASAQKLFHENDHLKDLKYRFSELFQLVNNDAEMKANMLQIINKTQK